jgi:hypothetical protein
MHITCLRAGRPGLLTLGRRLLPLSQLFFVEVASAAVDPSSGQPVGGDGALRWAFPGRIKWAGQDRLVVGVPL